MGMTETERRALLGNRQVALASIDPRFPGPIAFDPIAVRISEAVRISGLSRSEIYRRAGRGEIILLKSGRSTLVEYHSLRRAVASLPHAVIKGT
jgi:hypothetical protein